MLRHRTGTSLNHLSFGLAGFGQRGAECWCYIDHDHDYIDITIEGIIMADWKTCPGCHGSGEVDRKCAQCSGRGTIGRDRHGNDITCTQCGGAGSAGTPCPRCNGIGEIPA